MIFFTLFFGGLDHIATPSRAVSIHHLEHQRRILEFMASGQIIMTIQGLLSNLQSNWPKLACPSNDGTNFWSHEWEKHGTCADSVFAEYSNSKAALDLKSQLNLLQSLQSVGIRADGGYYSLTSVKEAIAGDLKGKRSLSEPI